MNERRAQVRSVLGALGLLLGISVYRQLSLRLWPGDLVRPYAVYAVYLFLLAFWMASLRSRITQKNMRFFLLLDAAVMLLWLSIRFVQDAFLLNKIYPLRFLGYFINVPAVFVPLLGFYASFGLGRGDDYRFAGKWRLLLLPALALTAMALTNESHHFLCRVVPTEPQPNLYFHPYIGTYLIILWALFFIAARTIVIYRRNRPPQNASALQKLAPYAEVCLLLIFSTPYVLSSFWVHWELIEFSAGVFFIEAASWELFIAIGLIPVNTQYKTVFDLSTAAMQIVTEDGRPVVRSAGAPELNARTLDELRRSPTVQLPGGRELQMYRLRSGCLIWQQDVSQLRSVIRQLQKTAAELEEEGALLSQELKLRSEEAAVTEQNRIYNQLTAEVGPQLSLLRQLLQKRDAAPDREALFEKICLLGTYVKRRCSLRLIEQSDGTVACEDLELSFRELTARLAEMGADAKLDWSEAPLPSAGFALVCLDVFEFLLEYARFEILSVEAAFRPDCDFSLRIRPACPRADEEFADKLERFGGGGVEVKGKSGPEGCEAVVRERGDPAC